MSKQLPEKFYNWAYGTRANTVKKIAAGEEVSHDKLFLSFTTHNPTFISNGPAGLNGSIKGIGFLPKEEYIPEILEAFQQHISKGWSDTYSNEGLNVLLKYVYGEDSKKYIDFTKLTSLEMAKKHSWENYKADSNITLLFYQPPAISFEVRGTIEIHEGDIYQKYVNASHDIYHKPDPSRWDSRPAYIINIAEIYDNSVGPNAFGQKLDY